MNQLSKQKFNELERGETTKENSTSTPLHAVPSTGTEPDFPAPEMLLQVKACNSLHASIAGPTISSATTATPCLLLRGGTLSWPFLPVPFYRCPLFPAVKPGSLHAIVGERGKQQPTSNTEIEQGKNDVNLTRRTRTRTRKRTRTRTKAELPNFADKGVHIHFKSFSFANLLR